ncbi:response regulator [uncultured Desulfobulbus sp.]|uniref:ATP-binding response regulator n=1 Tax=uncultured Desulfobulbus sp. TaxID=239745 RepID=UPI0029C95069|nr:response regulator [uncultured Desulfobulbus sp.]
MNEIQALVVDNSPVIRRILSYVLEAEGCCVQVAEDGLEALDCITRQQPDIVFTDLIMPKIDGEKLGYIIRNTPELKEIFLVVLSGVALEDNDATVRIGADVCIAKGPAAAMKVHIKAALEQFLANKRGGNGSIQGLEGLYPREVTSELLVSKRHREVILRRMTEGVVELNHQGRIVMANDAAVELFAESEAQVLGRHLVQLLPQPAREQISAWMGQLDVSASLPPLVFSYDEPILMGERQVTFNLVPVAEGEAFFIIGILQNVSQRKMLEQRQRQLEKELQRIRKLDAMSLMASGISHDFNNLLTIISGNVEMARYISRDENVSQLLGESTKALNLTAQLIRQFTTFSDNYLPQKSQVRLRALIDEVLFRELTATGIGYRLECSDDEPDMTVDPHLISQVFANLTMNALDAMGGAGRIEVTVDRVDGKEEAASTGQSLPGGELVRIVFSDSGPGIAPSIVEQVFDPYFSTKQKGAQKGMGLGLTIVHAIVKKHGGTVWIESPLTGGCTVILYFPLQGALVVNPNHRVPKGQGRQILVMDDEEMMRLINKKMFEHFGCTVTLATTGQEAVDLYRKKCANGKRFDLVLLDLRVDGGMGGLEAADKIAALDPEAAMVAISGDSGNEVIRYYTEHNFVAALAKPFSIDAVEDLVNRFL